MVKKTGLNDKKKTVEKKVVTRKKSTSKKSLVENQNENILEKKDSGFLMGKNFIPDFGEQVLTFRGVKTHNLRNIDIDLPKNKIITVTGVSGSGKSSFAFDTVYKEGQYRYIESLSSYLRQFFNLGERPDIDYSSGLSPAIAIEQNKRVGNARSTVGTLTEIDDYLRLLFAKLGDIYSYGSGKPIKAQTIDQIIDDMKHLYLGKKIYLVQLVGHFDDSREFLKFVKKNRMKVEQGEGFTRYLMVMNDKKIPSSDEILLEKDQEDTMMGNFGSNIKISGSQKIAQKTESESSKSVEKQTSTIEYFYLESPHVPEKFFPVQVYGIFDRVTVEEQKIPRLKEDIVKILGMSKKFGVYCSLEDKQPSDSAVSKAMDKDVYNLAGQVKWYTDKNYCPDFDITYPDFAPHHFSPNRAEGACPVCHGLGENLNVDFDRILDPHAPFMKAVLPWRDSVLGQTILKKLAQKYSMNEEKLWKDQPDWFKEIVLQGDNEILRIGVAAKNVNMTYKGIQDVLTTQYNKGLLTVDFQAMFELKPCTECHGAKLRKESLYVFLYSGKPEKKPLNIKVDDMSKMFTLFDLQKIPVQQLVEVLVEYQKNTDKPSELVNRIMNPLIDRTKTIISLGLGHLGLNRQVDTLSGGEIQRLRLAKQLGNKLTGIIYVLDEPTIGLDTEEIVRTIEAIKTLKAMGNTIIVVEHNDAFIKASDWVVEIGPGAGDFGGHLIFNGPYEEFLKIDSLTSQYVRGEKKIQVDLDHTPTAKKVSIKKASQHNLKGVDVEINLGAFTIITGPSGAGKTTLMYGTLFKFLDEKQKFIQSYIRLQLLKKGMSWSDIIKAPVMQKEEYEHLQSLALQEFHKSIGVETIKGHEEIDNVIYIDQSSIGKTPRSCPATFIGVFDHMRKIYAGVPEAQFMGFGAGHFSFNSSKGSCTECEGYGYKKVELQFLPDTYVPCPLCHGKRYKPEILSVQRHGKNISEVLGMYVRDALEFFKDIHFIRDELELLVDIGLGYLRLGQPAHTLSGGESQRLKLSRHLLKSYKGHTVYFLDEPTVGLHPSDIEKLLHVLKKFLDNGDTILMIEHDKSLLEFADKVIILRDGVLHNA